MTSKVRFAAQFPLRRGLSEFEAATYLSLSRSFFRRLVEEGRMPRPRLLGKRRVWDILELDAAFVTFPHDREDDLEAKGDSWSDFQ